MPRLSHFGALLGIAAWLSAPVSAQTPAASAQTRAVKSSQSSARVQNVVVRGSGPAMEVEIQTSGAPVAPDTQAIAGPDRIVVDFPGALPASELRALKVNRGALKGIRTGLFFDNPPITRIVLDLVEPQSYRISTTQNAIVVKLGPVTTAVEAAVPNVPPAARLQNASLATGAPAKVRNALMPRLSAAVAHAMTSPLPSPVMDAPPQKLPLTVTFEKGMLRIRAEKATLAQVLFEVQRQTRAEIAIPAGAEQEQVAADLGPAPARDVLGSLLNGSAYNFIFVGGELSLERVILSRRDSSPF
ncbi:MAG TPA: AMIN domain-containing protein [Terriglobales bacterium]